MAAKLSYSPNEVPEVTGIGRTTVYAEIAEGRLRARKIGRRTVVLHDDLVEWLSELPERQVTPAQ